MNKKQSVKCGSADLPPCFSSQAVFRFESVSSCFFRPTGPATTACLSRCVVLLWRRQSEVSSACRATWTGLCWTAATQKLSSPQLGSETATPPSLIFLVHVPHRGRLLLHAGLEKKGGERTSCVAEVFPPRQVIFKTPHFRHCCGIILTLRGTISPQSN